MARFLNALAWGTMCGGFAMAVIFVLSGILSANPSLVQFIALYGFQIAYTLMFVCLGLCRLKNLLERAPPETLRRDGVVLGFTGFVCLLGCAFTAGAGSWSESFVLFWTTFLLAGLLLLAVGINFWFYGQKKQI